MRRLMPDMQLLGPVLAEMFPIIKGQGVVEYAAWADRNAKPRRARATYANGWTVEIRVSADGRVTSTQASFKVRFSSKPGAAE